MKTLNLASAKGHFSCSADKQSHGNVYYHTDIKVAISEYKQMGEEAYGISV